MRTADKIKKIKRHFSLVEPKILRLLEKMELEVLEAENDHKKHFAKLAREIISQQLGSGAARAIVGRFCELFPRKQPSPKLILEIPEKRLRAAGMSWAKAKSLRDLAEKTARGEIRFQQFHKENDQTVLTELTQVKGIGPWTAEMFLIFTLGREDVFSFGDLGLRKGFEKTFGKRLARNWEARIARWRPYRSYAALALWEASDNVK